MGLRSASGRWSQVESYLHINHLELLAVSKAVHEDSGDSISSPEQADVGHSDILSGSWNFSHTNFISPGNGQSECGRFFQGSGVKGVVPESSGGQQDTQVDHASLITFQFLFLHIKEGQESRWINALVQWWNFKEKYAFSPPQLIL